MSLEDNKRVARGFLEASLVGDVASMDAAMTDDATFWTLPSALSAGVQTKQEFLAFFPGFFTKFAGPFSMRFDEITAEDDRVCIACKGNVKLASGKTYESDYHWLFTLRDGKICRVKEYGNTAHAIEVFAD